MYYVAFVFCLLCAVLVIVLPFSAVTVCASLIWYPDPAVESSGGSVACTPEEARAEAESLLKLEEDEFLKSIAIIIEAKVGTWLGMNLF